MILYNSIMIHRYIEYAHKHSSQSSANTNLGCIWKLNIHLPDWNSYTDWLENVPSLLFLSCASLETALCLSSAVGFIKQIPCISLLWTLHGGFSPAIRIDCDESAGYLKSTGNLLLCVCPYHCHSPGTTDINPLLALQLSFGWAGKCWHSEY